VDGRDNLWVVANQQDELDVIAPNATTAQGPVAKVIAKRGDFNGVRSCTRNEHLLPGLPRCMERRN
jgi:hypothetical protein